MSMAGGTRPVYALLADGTTIEVRPAGPGDYEAVKAMLAAMSPGHTYLRFFSASPRSAEIEAREVCREPAPGRMALLALLGREVVGCARYATPGEPPGVAEVAFAVADHMHHRGVATLLLEHLVSAARNHQITTFTAQTLMENQAMLNVFARAGLPVQRRYAEGVLELTFPLGGTGPDLDSYLNAVAERERRADVASLRHVLAPDSVVVVGASRRPGTVGRAVLDNIRGGGYAGRLYAVNPHAEEVGGVACLSSVPDLPEPADLAVVAVAAAGVLEVADQCGRRGVRSLVVIASGLDDAARADLLAVCRRHGMRLVGPDSFGISVPGLGLDATFAARHPEPGVAGLVSQSGALGFAVVDQLSPLGVGISSFASVGDKLDVSGNDMLLWWERDGVTKVAVLYIESFGNPRKFARTARRVGARMPVVTVLAGRSPAALAGSPAAAARGSPAAAARGSPAAGPGVAPLVSREALFEQAGVIITAGFGELIETTALLATQPVPAGHTVAIVSNVGSAGLLAADACADSGLTVHRPGDLARRQLRALLPGGEVTGPVDTTLTVSSDDFRRCVELLAADENVDALVALVLPTGASRDLVAAIQQADVDIPLAAVVLNQPESVRLLPRSRGSGARTSGDGAPVAGASAAGSSVTSASAAGPSVTGASVTGASPARSPAGRVPAYGYPEAAVAALARAAGYGAWRAEPRGRVPEFAGVRADEARALVRGFLDSREETPRVAPLLLPLATTADLLSCYGIPLAGPGAAGAAGGTEVMIRVADDRVFGPLVVFGLGGAAAEIAADRAARLTPLTDADADKLIRSIRFAPLLQAQAGLAGLRDLLLRVSRLADDLPEVTALVLDPVIAAPDRVTVASARAEVAPYEPADPYLRKLR